MMRSYSPVACDTCLSLACLTAVQVGDEVSEKTDAERKVKLWVWQDSGRPVAIQ